MGRIIDMMQKRYLGRYLLEHPHNLDKMVFIAGPRQVGKTTLVQSLGPKLGFKNVLYLNWDRPKDRIPIRDINYTVFREEVENAQGRPLVIFDELHKYPKWKSFLKGYYDTFKKDLPAFVTGSARLDVYRRGGDSLLGRYWLFHLNPFSVGEMLKGKIFAPPKELTLTSDKEAQKAFEILMERGGFPEPLFSEDSTTGPRWRRMRRDILIREDLRDLSKIHDVGHVDNLMDLVIGSVGSTLSLNSLRESLDVSYNAVRTWLKWLEAIYYCFRIMPYSKRVARALKKECKYFLFDWSELNEKGARFENLAAMHFKKSVDFWNDIGSGSFELCYVRDLEKREVDFLILQDKKPWMLIECKYQDDEIPKSLRYLTSILRPQYSILLNGSDQPGKYRFWGDTKYLVVAFLKNFV